MPGVKHSCLVATYLVGVPALLKQLVSMHLFQNIIQIPPILSTLYKSTLSLHRVTGQRIHCNSSLLLLINMITSVRTITVISSHIPFHAPAHHICNRFIRKYVQLPRAQSLRSPMLSTDFNGKVLKVRQGVYSGWTSRSNYISSTFFCLQ